MKASTVSRRIVTGLLPISLRRALGVGRPHRAVGQRDLSRELYVLDLVQDDLTGRKKTFVDFGCGLMRIGETGKVNAYYIDTALSPYADTACDRRSVEALKALADASFQADGVICFSAVQYLTRTEVVQFANQCARLLPSEGVLFLEIDARDLMGGKEPTTGEVKYANAFVGTHRYCEELQRTRPRLGAWLLLFLRKCNLYVNCLGYDDYRDIFSNDFEITKSGVRSGQTNWQWQDCETVPAEALLFRLWLRPKTPPAT